MGSEIETMKSNQPKLSFTTMATPEKTGIEAIRMAKRFGYDGVDLRVSPDRGELSLDSSARYICEIRDALDTEGIQLSGLFCYNEKGGGDEKSWQKMIDSILRNLDIAARVGSPSIRIFSGSANLSGNAEDYIKRTAEAILNVLERDSSGVQILIQNHYKNFSAAQCSKTIEMVANPLFKMAFSPDHCVVQNEKTENISPVFMDKVVQFYVADLKKGNKDQKYIHVLPGKGDVDILSLYKLLGEDVFHGWITFKWEKIWNPEIEDAEIALPYFIEYFKNINK